MSIIEIDDQPKQCRICLEDDHPSNEMISPCLCRGSSAYVHRKCLNLWRSENANGKGFEYCNVCQFKYVIQTIIDDPKSERERLFKYYFFVFGDIISIILFIQIIVFILSFILNIIDRNGQNIKDLFPNSINGFFVYYLSASILLLALIGFFTLIFFCFAIGIPTNNSGSCSRTLSSSSGKSIGGWFAAFSIVILIFAVIGVFVGIILTFVILKKIRKDRTQQFWLRQEAEKYFVKDFHGRRNQL